MATYNDYRALSDYIYNFGKTNPETGKLFDMTTIKDLDITDEQKNKDLVGHLASADFFTVDSFPTSTFAITSVKALEGNPEATHEISGNLTIKGVSRQITFPSKVTLN